METINALTIKYMGNRVCKHSFNVHAIECSRATQVRDVMNETSSMDV